MEETGSCTHLGVIYAVRGGWSKDSSPHFADGKTEESSGSSQHQSGDWNPGLRVPCSALTKGASLSSLCFSPIYF